MPFTALVDFSYAPVEVWNPKSPDKRVSSFYLVLYSHSVLGATVSDSPSSSTTEINQPLLPSTHGPELSLGYSLGRIYT
ncbi:hypothetical protein N3K66_004718 [Trichothecium roseum]|uniref:Uncharacterized protein n=1 Tax=Trichothecium roseum TaxID=47278 RepID=A0ACC0V4S4_9HYPO|nr:hypothetical protein N3K66_004718 [Trichothecium roseum]